MTTDETKQMILDRHLSAQNARGDRETAWQTCYQNYLGVNSDSDDKYFLPETFTSIETMLPRLIDPFQNNTKPVISVQGRMPEDHVKAEKIEALLCYQFQRARIAEKIEQLCRQNLIYGTSIARTYWNFQKGMKKEQQAVQAIDEATGLPYISGWEKVDIEKVIADDPAMEVVSVYDFYIDPAATSIEDARFVIHEKALGREEVLELAESGYYDTKEVNRMLTEMEEGTAQTNSAKQVDLQQKPSFDISQQSGIPGKFKIYEYWEKDRVIVLAEDAYILKDEENPFGYIPFVATNFIDLPFQFYGIGVAESIQDLQGIANDIVNMRLQNVELSIHGMFLARMNCIDQKDLKAKPGKVIFVKDGNPGDALIPIKIPDVSASSWTEQQNIKMAISDITGVNEYTKGQASDITPKQTATEVMSKTQQASTRFEHAFKRFARAILAIAEHFLSMSQEYITEEKIVRVFGKTGQTDFQTITTEDIAGDYDIVLSVDPLRADEQKRKENLLQYLSIISQNPMLPQTNMKMLGIIAEALEIDPEVKEMIGQEAGQYAQMAGAIGQEETGMPAGMVGGIGGMPGMEGDPSAAYQGPDGSMPY